MKVNKNKIDRGGRWFSGLFAGVACAAMLLFGGCVHDDLTDGAVKGSGKRVHATLSVDLAAQSVDEKTRSSLDAGQLKLETVWVGVFDTKTGEMVGYWTDRPLKEDSTHVTMRDNNGSWTVSDIDIYYYDSNPEVYIAGVANFEHVQARKVGDDTLTDLAELLGVTFNGTMPEVTRYITWEDLCAISVDTKSIDAAARKIKPNEADNYPLVMGFFSANNSRHVTVDRDGKAEYAKVPLTEGGQPFASDIQPNGRIYLRRMVSDINVNINFGSTPSYDIIKEVTSLRYKVINKPVEMYLAEHDVDQIGGQLSGKDNYLSRTANSADWLAEGYESDEDWITVNGSIEDGYSFKYSHYENKHWGVDWEMEPGTHFSAGSYYGPSVPSLGHYDEETDEWIPDTETRTWRGYFDELIKRNGTGFIGYLSQGVQASAAHRIREAKLTDGETPLFKTLCQAENRAFNNNASYILIEAEMTWQNAMDGSVTKGKYYYTIHEGYTSHADGTAVPAPGRATSKSDIYDAICDFQTIRNTKYTYNLTFSGINTIRMQAMSDDYGNGLMHDDGYTGQSWRSSSRIVQLSGAGNANTYQYERGDHGGMLYYFYDPNYNGSPVDMIPLYDYFDHDYEARKRFLKWRLYEKRPDTGEVDYGTCNTDTQFDWIDIKGELKSFEDLQALDDNDPMKKFYNAIRVHVGYQDYWWSDEACLESLFSMTLEEYINGAEKDRLVMYPGDSFIYFITVDAYDVDDEIENHPNYKRGFYLIMESEDYDGCLYSEILTGAEQGPHDSRAEWLYFKPLYMQGIIYNGYNSDKFNNVYSAAQNFSHTEYIRWYVPVSYYYGPDDENLPSEWRSWWGSSNGNAHEPLSYTIYIDGQEVDTVEWNSEYRHNNSNYTFNDYLHVNTERSYYFAWPYDPNDYAAGDHEIVIKANVDEEYTQPLEIRTTLRLIEKPLWKFDNDLYPILSNPYNGSYNYYQYASMLAIFYSYMYIYSDGPNEGYAYWSSSYGQLYGPTSSYNDRDLFRFKIDNHGTFRVRIYNSGYRYVYFAVRTKNNTSTDSRYVYGSQELYFRTRDIIKNFDDGPLDVALYGGSSNVSFYEIEWIPDEDQNPNYPGDIEWTNQLYGSDYNSNGSSYMYIQPYYPYRNNGEFLLTPGMTNYFGFYDTDPQADKYRIEIYDRDDFYGDMMSPNVRPVLSREFDADEVRQSTWNGTDYFVCPLHIPANGVLRDNYYYYIAITPISDNYVQVPVSGFSGRVYPNADSATEWWDPNLYSYGSNKNPYCYSEYNNSWKFYNYDGAWMEYNGLVLHGGTASMYISSNYIEFGGDGYPYRNGSTPSFGRHLTFTTERPGYVVLNATASSADRYFHLYAVVDGVPEQRDRKAIAVGGAPFMLSTGRVDGPTEFIICPEGGVYLSGARFVPNSEVDGRESLDTSLIAYSNWSTDAEKPIHPGIYDISYSLDDDEYWEDYGYDTKEFLLARHFSSPISFSDSDPRATAYKLQLFYEPTFSNQNFDRPAFEVEISADDYVTYTGDDGSKVFTYTLFFGNDCSFVTGEYLAFLTPVGDPEVYQPASPQFLTKIIYIDWTNPMPIYKPVPPDYGDDYEEEQDPFEEIYRSPIMGWYTAYFALSSETDSDYYYDVLPKPRDLVKDEYVEFVGLTINGSGAEDRSKNVQIRGYNGSYSSYDVPNWWTFFPGEGYPKVSGDNNVGTGRNLTITTDVAGKILVIARADQQTQRSFALYKKTGTTTTKIGDSKPVIYSLQTSLDDIAKAIELTTGDVSGPTEFIICPEGGSSEIVEVMFIKEGSAAYDWNWSEGYPGYEENDDDDDANGLSLLTKMSTSRIKAHGVNKFGARIPLRR